MRAAEFPAPRLRRLTEAWPAEDADLVIDALAGWWERLGPSYAVQYEADLAAMGDMPLRAHLRAILNHTAPTTRGVALAWARRSSDPRRDAGMLLAVERTLANPDRQVLREELEHLAGGAR